MGETVAVLAGALVGVGLLLQAISRHLPRRTMSVLVWLLVVLAAVQYGPALLRLLAGRLLGVRL